MARIAARGTVADASAGTGNEGWVLHSRSRLARRGGEQYGRDYATKFMEQCVGHSKKPEDALATATALTAQSIAESYAQFVRRRMKGSPVDYIVSGGGARNATLMKMLACTA